MTPCRSITHAGTPTRFTRSQTDLLALAHGPALRVTVLVQLPGDGVIEALAEVEPA
jgi:hypothetical protein